MLCWGPTSSRHATSSRASVDSPRPPLPLLPALLLLPLLLLGLPGCSGIGIAGQADHRPLSKQAYVTLLYGEPYVLGARVLGQSLKETGTNRRAHAHTRPHAHMHTHMPRAAAAAHPVTCTHMQQRVSSEHGIMPCMRVGCGLWVHIDDSIVVNVYTLTVNTVCPNSLHNPNITHIYTDLNGPGMLFGVSGHLRYWYF